MSEGIKHQDKRLDTDPWRQSCNAFSCQSYCVYTCTNGHSHASVLQAGYSLVIPTVIRNSFYAILL